MAVLTTEWQKIAEQSIANTSHGVLYSRLYAKYNSYNSSAGTVNVSTLFQVYLSNGTAYSNGCFVSLDGANWSGNINISGGEENVQNLVTSTYDVSTNTDGSSRGYVTSATYDIYGVHKTISTTFDTPKIPRYANITSFNCYAIDEATLRVNWSTDVYVDTVQYSINDTTWVTAISGTTFDIGNLNAGTQYGIKIRVKRGDSQLWTESGYLNPKTYDYPHCTNPHDFIIGDALTLNFYNPLGRTITVTGLFVESENTPIFTATTNGTSLTGFNSASEIDNMYQCIPTKKYGYYSVRVSTNYSSVVTPSPYSKFYINETLVKPTFENFTYIDNNSNIQTLVENNQILVDNNSTPLFTISPVNKATAYKYASIVNYIAEWGNKNNSGSYSDDSDVNIQVDASTGSILKVTAFDSRGLSATVTKTITNIPYINAVINSLEVQRNNGVEAKTYLAGKFTIWKGNWNNDNNANYDNRLKYVGYRVFINDSWSQYYDITNNVLAVISSYDSGNTTQISFNINDGVEIHKNGSSGGFTIGEEFHIQVLIKDGTSSSIFTPSNYQAILQAEVPDGKVYQSVYKDDNGDYHIGLNDMPVEDYTVNIGGSIKEQVIDITSKISKSSNVGNIYNINAYRKGTRCYLNATVDLLGQGLMFTLDSDIIPKYNEKSIGSNYSTTLSVPATMELGANNSGLYATIFGSVGPYLAFHIEWEI